MLDDALIPADLNWHSPFSQIWTAQAAGLTLFLYYNDLIEK